MKKRKKTKKIITISLFISLMFIAGGYSAFNTNINLKAKGNIYDKGDLCYETEDNGDGTITITIYDETCGSEVIIPEKIKGKPVTKIGSTYWQKKESFDHKRLKKVVIPDTVISIGDFAFSGNYITNLKLGSNLEEIGAEAFHDNWLTSLTFPKTLKKIGSGAFMKNYLTEIPSLDNIKYEGGIFSLNSLKKEDAFIYDKNEDGEIDYTSLNSYATREYTDVLNIPDGIKNLSYQSLRFSNAGTINMPDGIETIGISALHQTKAKIVNIPSSIKEIKAGAFDEAYNLEEININKPANSISNSPWSAPSATVNWIE